MRGSEKPKETLKYILYIYIYISSFLYMYVYCIYLYRKGQEKVNKAKALQTASIPTGQLSTFWVGKT